jgi:hypothetical protein
MPRSTIFDNFLPLTGEINTESPYAFYLELIVMRARRILKTRSEGQITDALDVLYWMIQEGDHEQLKEAQSKDFDQSGYVMTEAKALRLFMPLFDIKQQETFPDAKWEEYFATLALSQVAQIVISAELSTANTEFPDIQGDYSSGQHKKSVQLDQLLEAAETISAAEFLAEGKNYMARAGSAGGKRRVKKFEQLKQHVHKEWETKHKRRTNRDAAKRIWGEMPEDYQKVLSTDEPQKRLEIWIGKWKKGIAIP